MEKFFTIDKDSKFYQAYVQYLEDLETNAKVFDTFANEQGIEAKQYLPLKDTLRIIPTEHDMQAFGSMFLAKDFGDNIKQFRQNSKIAKAWVEAIKEMQIAKEPTYFNYGMHFNGRFSTRCFMIADTLYGTVEANHDIQLLDFMKEIKASEFYKAIEDENEKRAAANKETEDADLER